MNQTIHSELMSFDTRASSPPPAIAADSRTGPSNEARIPPPSIIKPDELTASERGRLRSLTKRAFRFRRSRKSQHNSQSPSPSNYAPTAFDDVNEGPVLLNSESSALTALSVEDHARDVYQWAILYENQRGYVSFARELDSSSRDSILTQKQDYVLL